MRSWPVQEAKAKFSALLEASLQEGPQMVTKRGMEAAVLVPAEEWRRLNQQRTKPSIKEVLLGYDSARDSEFQTPPRTKWRSRRNG